MIDFTHSKCEREQDEKERRQKRKERTKSHEVLEQPKVERSQKGGWVERGRKAGRQRGRERARLSCYSKETMSKGTYSWSSGYFTKYSIYSEQITCVL